MKHSFLTFLARLPRRPLAVAALLCAAALSACTQDSDLQPDRTAMLPSDQQVSSVPWNKPQGWENTSQLGALANDPRIGGGGGSGSGGFGH